GEVEAERRRGRAGRGHAGRDRGRCERDPGGSARSDGVRERGRIAVGGSLGGFGSRRGGGAPCSGTLSRPPVPRCVPPAVRRARLSTPRGRWPDIQPPTVTEMVWSPVAPFGAGSAGVAACVAAVSSVARTARV